MTPIVRTVTLETPAERLAVGVFQHPFPYVTHAFAMLMLSIAVKLECGVAPVKRGRG